MAESYFGLHIPYLELLGVRPERRADGVAAVSLDVRPELTNSWDVAHGGVVMALLDCAMAFAARSTVPGAGGVVTVDMAVNFVRAGRGRLGAEGRVLRNGGSLIFCEGEVRDAEGALVAKGLGTFKLRRRDRDAAGFERSTS